MRKRNKKIRNSVFVLLALLGLFLAISYLPFDRWSVETKNNTASSTPEVDLLERAFSNIKIQAKAAYVVDLTTDQVLFRKNENMPLPLASVTKLMTALVSSQILSPNDIITVGSSSLATEGDNGLLENQKWRFKDLLDFTLLVSSNDGANAIALAAAGTEDAFVEKMNAEALTLALPTLHFKNESGLDIDTVTPGAVGSAHDISLLFEHMIKNDQNILEITKYRKFRLTARDGKVYNVSNTDEAIPFVSHIIASKTGFTRLAGGNLVIAYDPGLNHPVIITILGSTQSGRFNDIIALASSTSAYILSQ